MKHQEETWWKKARKGENVLKEPLNYESLIRKSVCDCLREYMKNCSLSGVKSLVKEDLTKTQKLIWFIALLATYITVIVTLYSNYVIFFEKPIVMNLKTTQYKLTEVEFPGVAICNVNKISRKAAKELAEILNASPFRPKNMNKEKLIQFVFQFGRLIDFHGSRYEHLVPYIEFFHDFYDNYTFGDVRRLMEGLSPKCEEFLIDCSWNGYKVNCSDLFTTSVTYQGHCCLFNYGSKYYTTANHQRHQKLAGARYGLTAVLNAQVDDYAYTYHNTEGFEVIIFDGNYYPSSGTGATKFTTVDIGHNVYIELNANTMQSLTATKFFSIDQRQCKFSNEDSGFSKGYNYHKCIISCRLKTILYLCNCIPYSYQYKGMRIPECFLDNIPCLNKYREKLNSIFPGEDTEGLEEEQVDSLYCPECYHDCSYVMYKFKTYTYPTSDFKLGERTSSNSTSKVSIYFSTIDSTLYQMDLLFYWFDLVCNFGGTASLIVGFSIVSLAEIVYFVIIRFPIVVRRNRITYYY